MSAMPSPLKSARNGVSRKAHAAARRRRLERAVALAQKHPDRAVVIADGDQVGQAVAIDVGHDGLRPVLVGGEGLLVPKGRCPIEQDAHAVAAVVGGDDVGLAVAGQVGDGDRIGPRADGVGLLGLECAVAVAQKHAHRVARRRWR